MKDKVRFPVNFTVSGAFADFRGADNKPVCSLKVPNISNTTYVASTVCKALNAYHNLCRALEDTIQIAESVQASMGIDPIQRARLNECKAYLSGLRPKSKQSGRYGNPN